MEQKVGSPEWLVSEILRFRHRYPVIAAKVPGFSFNAALLVRLGRRAKLCFEAPV